MISLHSPNGQFGCLFIRFGDYSLTVGLRPSMAGVDLFKGSRCLFVFPPCGL